MSGSSVVRELTRNRKVDAALTNEQITRQRVDKLEAESSLRAKIAAIQYDHIASIDKLLSRGFWGRLRWLLRGR